MTDAPWLPLSRSQAARLVRSLEAALPEDGDVRGEAAATRLGPVLERTVVTLVRTLREESGTFGASDGDERKEARKRARRAGFVTGAFGAVGGLPREAVELIEQARAALDVADEVAPGRSDEQLAADLLVVWGLVADPAAALAFTTEAAPEPLLSVLLREQHERIKDAIPDRWTVRSTLGFLWKARVLRDVGDALRGNSGFVQSIPIVGALPGAWHAGRAMQRFQDELRVHLTAAPPPADPPPADPPPAPPA